MAEPGAYRLYQSEQSGFDVEPSAPPLRDTSSPQYPPPTYNSVERDRQREAGRSTLTRSLAYAGTTVGRFFGVHDNELERWQRAGTLTRGNAALGYSIIPQNGTELGAQQRNGAEVATSPETEVAPSSRRTSRVQRVANTLTGTLRRRVKPKPSREDVMKTLPTFWPVMTIVIALIEVAFCIAVIVTGGLAPIRFTPETEFTTIFGFDNRSESTSRSIVPNFFIGTSKSALVHTGAMYAPCIRENIEFQVNVARDRLQEDSELRCCKSSSLSQCGMLPRDTCTGIFQGDVLGGASRCREELNQTADCTGGVTLHPCCVGLLGECVITTEDNCTFQEGYWHPDKLLCSEVGTDCFNGICEFTWIHKTIGQVPDQGLRFLSAIFLYDGAIHLLIIGLFKLYNSWTIERRIGWLRFLCVYILSGVGGFLVSGIFDATSVSVGGSGALFGLLGVLLVELLQGWKWVKRPCVELVKLLVLIVILLAVGTLPYIDNFSQIGGFIFGMLASFIFVPYITIGKWDRAKKLCLLCTAVPIILALFLVGFVVFYNLPNPDFCPKCSYINCIPYTSTFCEDFITTILMPIIPG